MSDGDAAERGRVLCLRQFRMRGVDVTFESDSEELDRGLASLVNRADEWHDPVRHVRFRLTTAADGRPAFAENDGAAVPMRSLPDALAAVHRRLGTHLYGAYERYPFLHAAAVTIDRRLVVLAGARGAGKTTLTLRLALDGAAFHTDEHVLASADGLVRTVPRRLHVKPGTFLYIPEIEAVCRRHPLLVLDGGTLFYPLDLLDLGIEWRSVDARPSAIVHLVPGFDDPPAVERIGELESVKRLFRQAQSGDMEFGRQAGDICGIVRGVPSFHLRVGPLADTARVVREIAADLPCR